MIHLLEFWTCELYCQVPECQGAARGSCTPREMQAGAEMPWPAAKGPHSTHTMEQSGSLIELRFIQESKSPGSSLVMKQIKI